MDVAAVLGANMVEKTITENRMTRSVEHIMSIEPPDAHFCEEHKEVEVGLGGERRILSEQELKNRDAVRRSILRSSAKKVSG